MTLRSAYTQLLQKSAFRRRGKEASPVVLEQGRVFILPTRQGVLFAVVLALMFTGSINYDLNLGYALTFLLAGLALISILHTHRNLANLVLRWGRANPVFAGQTAAFPVILENPGRYTRFAIGVQPEDGFPIFDDVPAANSATLHISALAPRRGRLRCPRLRIYTRFPLGLFHAWFTVEPDAQCLVYPSPEKTLSPFPSPLGGGHGAFDQGMGDEDFATLRNYQFGDPASHVAWKALAREQGLLTKQFSGQADAELWFDWDSLNGMDTEARLERLCRWVVEAGQTGVAFGMRLPGRKIPVSGGEHHRTVCLEALALFGQDSLSEATK